MKSNFDVQYWLHVGEMDSTSQPITSRIKNLSWNNEPVSFSSFNNNMETIISRIEAAQTDITVNYNNWLKIGHVLANEFGEAGRGYYHRMSRFNARYSADRCNSQYNPV